MAIFEKDVLYVGRVVPPNRDPIDFQEKDVERLAVRVQEMLADGLQIPIAWEHQDAAKPMMAEELARLTKLTLGHALEAEVRPGGTLQVKFDAPVEEDAKRLPAIKFVSPEIQWNYRDGRGKVWPGPSITHLAVTPQPVQHDQKPFKRVDRFSVLRLSLTDYVRLGMPEEQKDGEEAKSKDGDGKEEKKAASAEAKPYEEKLKAVLGVLSEVGMPLPEDTYMSQYEGNFLEHLHGAAGAHLATKQDKKETEQDAESQKPKPAPDQGGISLSLQEKTKGLENYVLGLATKDLGRRIKALFETGRINKPIHDKLEADLKTVKLSLSDTGEPAPCPLAAKIEAYEELEEGTAWASTQLSLKGVKPADKPSWMNDPTNSKEDAEKTVDTILEMNRGKR